jgi:hypothetical protein
LRLKGFSLSNGSGDSWCILKVLLMFLVELGLDSGLHTCKAGTLLLEPHLQFILLWLVWKWSLADVAGLTLNCDPLDPK